MGARKKSIERDKDLFRKLLDPEAMQKEGIDPKDGRIFASETEYFAAVDATFNFQETTVEFEREALDYIKEYIEKELQESALVKMKLLKDFSFPTSIFFQDSPKDKKMLRFTHAELKELSPNTFAAQLSWLDTKLEKREKEIIEKKKINPLAPSGAFSQVVYQLCDVSDHPVITYEALAKKLTDPNLVKVLLVTVITADSVAHHLFSITHQGRVNPLYLGHELEKDDFLGRAVQKGLEKKSRPDMTNLPPVLAMIGTILDLATKFKEKPGSPLYVLGGIEIQ